MYKRLKDCELFVLDMDGTLYLGDEVFPGAVDFLRGLETLGKQFLYLTNNSSRAVEDYVNRLRKLGFPCEREQVLTSGMATGLYLQDKYPGARVFLVGTEAFRRELTAYGITFSQDDADVVVAGFDTELVYEKLSKAVRFLRRGAAFIAANPDWVCPMPAGEVLPDCGSICALLTAASGKEPFYIGKPNQSIIDLAADLTGVPNERICCVGDRLYTDIAAAQNAGTVSVCVLSGETSREMLDTADLPPDYVFRDVAELHQVLMKA